MSDVVAGVRNGEGAARAVTAQVKGIEIVVAGMGVGEESRMTAVRATGDDVLVAMPRRQWRSPSTGSCIASKKSAFRRALLRSLCLHVRRARPGSGVALILLQQHDADDKVGKPYDESGRRRGGRRARAAGGAAGGGPHMRASVTHQ